ncbi:MAG: hypothetical protein ACNA77_08465 [Opitutales bacterium]
MAEDQEVELLGVTELFRRMGAGDDQAETMARQLLKRARQIAQEQDITEVEAAQTLLNKVIQARQGGSSSS